MMRSAKFFACGALLVAACSGGGGGKDAPKDDPKTATKAAATGEKAGDPVAAAAQKVDDVQAFLNDNSKALSPEIYEKLVVALESCTVNENGIDYKCEAWRNLEKARSRNTALKDLVGASSSIGKKHIGDAAPAIRLQSARMMGSIFGSDNTTQDLIVEAANKEKEPAVLKAMINVVGSRHKGNEKVKELLLKNADHENERVRMESMSWFLTSFGEGVPGTFDKVLEHLGKDPSEKVRAYLCSRLYGSGDARAMKELEKYLGAKDTSKDLFAGCWDGAIASWTGFPFPANPQQKGYELVMKVLNTKPRTTERPPWTGISTLRAAKTEFKPEDKFGNDWYGKVKGWYKKDKLLAALESLADDKDANWMARTGALDVMRELGAPKATFEKLLKKYEKEATGDGSHIKRKIEDNLKKLNEPAPAAAPGAPAPAAPAKK